jgi:site-specific DNA-methyltransferase (adenine-specific)
MISEVHLMDNLEYMAVIPDKFFELVIADPEYGIGASKKKSYHANALTNYSAKKWDSKIPSKEYFNELFRISKNQIIWGGNYFSEHLPSKPKWIVWDKMQPEGIDQAMFELAWSSQDKIQAKIYRQSAQSNANKVANNRREASKYIRIHPTQKPITLYRWILSKYAKSGDKIFDPNMGSQSSRIAAWDMGFDYWGVEIDPDYFESGNKRFEQFKMQQKLFV